MTNPTRQDVLAEIEQRFPGSNRTSVFKMLNLYGAKSTEPERERVQLAILERSDGSVDKVRELVEQAKKDHRSVLQAVGAAPAVRNSAAAQVEQAAAVARLQGTAAGQQGELPGWAWLFIIGCVLIPILRFGGIFTITIGLGGAAWCRRIARDENSPVNMRIGFCAGVTAVAWLVTLFLG